MAQRVTPMIHVPDVQQTVEWYQSVLGFTVEGTGEDGVDMVWAELSFGEGRIMFNTGGEPSDAFRREMDLYIETKEIDALFEQLKDKVSVFEPPHNTFYGMREFIIRDLNNFWITFGERIKEPVS